MTPKGLLKSVGASDALVRLVDAHAAETAVLALLPYFADRNLFRIAVGDDHARPYLERPKEC